MSKLRIWQEHTEWNEAEKKWDDGIVGAAQEKPLKSLKSLPSMKGITEETARHLKWKSLKWMVTKDHAGEIRRAFFKHPFKYGWAFLKSIIKTKPYKREGDFFLYGVDSIKDFQNLLDEEDSLFVLGFSYCHKPFECPSGRFTPDCIHDPENAVCRQCFIGKAVNALPTQNTVPLFIPTIHYIAGKILDLIHQNPDKRIIFLITACEMTLEMFGDWGNMADIRGVGVRLDGRICNTMKAFELSENGVKPGLTVVLDDTQRCVLDLLRYRWECQQNKPKV